MVAVVTPGIDAGMWLPVAHFAVGGKHLRRPAQSIFQTIGLVMPEGCESDGS
jgi:hypothetical protein